MVSEVKSVGEKLGWALGVAAAVVTIGSVGHCVGRSDSKSEMQELESRLRACEAHLQDCQLADVLGNGRTDQAKRGAKAQQEGSGDPLNVKPDVPRVQKKLPRELPVFEAEASSEKYPAMNVLDNNLSVGTWTSRWITADREIEGAWLELHLPPATVTAIRIFMVIQEQFAGGQIRRASLSFMDGSVQEVEFPFKAGWQQVEITPVKTELVRITVKSVYPGQEEGFGVDVFEAKLIGIADES